MKIVAIIAIIFLIVHFVSKKYAKGQEKIKKHIENGDIIPGDAEADFNVHQSFRELANK
jgi:hypothetical protein